MFYILIIVIELLYNSNHFMVVIIRKDNDIIAQLVTFS